MAGQIERNLDILLKLLDESLKYIGSLKREDVTITNSIDNVEYKEFTSRTEATEGEVLNKKILKD